MFARGVLEVPGFPALGVFRGDGLLADVGFLDAWEEVDDVGDGAP